VIQIESQARIAPTASSMMRKHRGFTCEPSMSVAKQYEYDDPKTMR